MAIEGLERIIGEHPLFAGLGQDFLSTVTGCAMNVRFRAGEYLFHEGDAADRLYLIREGMVALEISEPGQGRMTFLTVARNGVVGMSWLVPPYRWTFDARAIEDTRALAFDAGCLRGKCDSDPALGYAVMKRFMPVLVERLHNTRVQMLDVYGVRS
jgi:CRP/FNR family cyclic AMP-dependent transcriptional regulator